MATDEDQLRGALYAHGAMIAAMLRALDHRLPDFRAALAAHVDDQLARLAAENPPEPWLDEMREEMRILLDPPS
jgi:hypothetical protein